MALTQMQIIQSLGDAMSWFERERGWDVPATEQRHLCGRIGELYAALITNGQMATAPNQHGYDVVSGLGERISVKTTATMDSKGHVAFNPRTLHLVDRVMVLRINTEEMQVEILFDGTTAEAAALMAPEAQGKRALPLRRLLRVPKPESEMAAVSTVTIGEVTLIELESGAIRIESQGAPVTPAMPIIRDLAQTLGIPVLNANGNPINTRQLGSQVIRALKTQPQESVLL